MGVVRKTISLTKEHHEYVRSCVVSGEFASDSEVMREALREKIERAKREAWLLEEVQKGIDSGYSALTTDQVFAQAEAKFNKKHNVT